MKVTAWVILLNKGKFPGKPNSKDKKFHGNPLIYKKSMTLVSTEGGGYLNIVQPIGSLID